MAYVHVKRCQQFLYIGGPWGENACWAAGEYMYDFSCNTSWLLGTFFEVKLSFASVHTFMILTLNQHLPMICA